MDLHYKYPIFKLILVRSTFPTILKTLLVKSEPYEFEYIWCFRVLSRLKTVSLVKKLKIAKYLYLGQNSIKR